VVGDTVFGAAVFGAAVFGDTVVGDTAVEDATSDAELAEYVARRSWPNTGNWGNSAAEHAEQAATPSRVVRLRAGSRRAS
jgi:hypothetical protein